MLIDALALGAALGVRHALEPDHLAAITTMVNGNPRDAARTGAAWGLGHAIAVVLLGGALIALGVRVPTRVAIALEVAVAIMLVLLGAHALRTRHARAASPHGRSTMVGFVHGASGTAAITVICATTLRSAPIGLAFLLVFAIGATLSMSAMSGLLATPLSAVRSERALAWLRVGGAIAAFAAAAFVLLQVLHGA